MRRLSLAARLALVALAVVALTSCAATAARNGTLPTPLPNYAEATLFGRRPMTLLNTHLGVWEDTRECLEDLGLDVSPTPAWSVRWSVADSLKMDEGFWAYGLSIGWGDEAPQIVIEAPWWLNAGIVSHEAIHVLTKNPSHRGKQWECEMPTYGELPLREWRYGAPARVKEG